jgi:truncated hemoglobin YjbI
MCCYQEECEEWLDLMKKTLIEPQQKELIDEDSCKILMDYFTYTAHSIMVYHREAVRLIPEVLKHSS